MANNLLLDMLNLMIYDMLCFAQSVPRTYVEFVTFLMFYCIGDKKYGQLVLHGYCTRLTAGAMCMNNLSE